MRANSADALAAISRLVTKEYEFGPPTMCLLLHSGENNTYAVKVPGHRFALRVHGPNKGWLTNEGDVRFELQLLDHLHADGVPVSTPLPRRNGDLLGTWKGPAGARYFTLFSWAPGRALLEEELTQEHARTVGKTLAAIHNSADKYRPTYIRHFVLDERTLLDPYVQQLYLKDEDPSDAQYIDGQVAEIRRQLSEFEPGTSGWGIIHGDVQVKNYHITAFGDITFFDFDGCGYGWRAYDIAIYYTRIPKHLSECVLDGYEELRPLGQEERNMLPTLARLGWIKEGCRSKELVESLRDPFMSF